VVGGLAVGVRTAKEGRKTKAARKRGEEAD